MKQMVKRCLCLLTAVLLMTSIAFPTANAEEITDPEVLEVIDQLEAIDTLQQMQNNRSKYKVKSRYRADTTDESIITAHENAREQYETYLSEMFAARLAAQQAYDALTEAQQAQIDPALVAKLSNELSTDFTPRTCEVTPQYNEYIFEAVDDPQKGMCYEASNHLTLAPEIPATFILVDTSDGKTSWTADGMYVPGVSNYEVTYCCDVETGLTYKTHYKRMNLEDSTYFGKDNAEHIRGILMNSYPFVTMDEMKAWLKSGGLDAELVDQLTRADLIAGVQMAIWAYANADSEELISNLSYCASHDIPANRTAYMDPIHDYTNEIWDYWTTSLRQYTYDAEAEYRVNNLVYFLCNTEGIAADGSPILVSDVQITRAELIDNENGTYRVGMYVLLNDGGSEDDNLKVTVTSYTTAEDGSRIITGKAGQNVYGSDKLSMSVVANYGDIIEVVVEGTQEVGKNVYFYEPEGGRGASQCLVGVGMGKTNVYASKSFTLNEDIDEMGLRIYKTEKDTGKPISDITFSIYKVEPEENETLNTTPTREEIAKYKIDENKVASIVTDITGYGAIELDEGIYLVVEEEHEKIKEPVDPFYVYLPMPVEKEVEGEDGEIKIEIEYLNIVSVYPKNEPEEPPIVPPPPPPPPQKLKGKLRIYKYDESNAEKALEGAVFQLYKAANADDVNIETLECNGVKYAVVPVYVDGEPVILTTGADGNADSPLLDVGSYFLKETKAPKGYNLLEDSISVHVRPLSVIETTVYEIPNVRGNILPETGGIGTRIFTITGITMTLIAVTLLVTKKRVAY